MFILIHDYLTTYHQQRTMTEHSIRYQRIQEISQRALNECIKAVTIDELHSCFPTIASSSKGRNNLNKAHAQFVELWQTRTTKEFLEIFEERDIKQKLAELDEVLEKARQRSNDPSAQPVYIDRLTPTQLIEANLKTYKKQRLEDLQRQVAEVQAQNQQLESQMHNMKESLRSQSLTLSDSFQDLAKAVSKAEEELPSRQQIAQLVGQIIPRS